MQKQRELIEKLVRVRDDALSLATYVEGIIADAGGAVGFVTGGTADPVTTPLGPDGLWVPPELARLAGDAERAYPNGLRNRQVFNFNTGRWEFERVRWPEGLYASACIYKHQSEGGGLARDDLTDKQRDTLHFFHNESLPLTIIDGGSTLNFRPVGEAPDRGPFLAMIPNVYTGNMDRLWRDLRNYFANIGIE